MIDEEECRGNRRCARRHHNKCIIIMRLLFIIIATTILLPTAHAQTGTEACSTAACTSTGGKCVQGSNPNVSDSLCADCADGKVPWWPCVSCSFIVYWYSSFLIIASDEYSSLLTNSLCFRISRVLVFAFLKRLLHRRNNLPQSQTWNHLHLHPCMNWLQWNFILATWQMM